MLLSFNALMQRLKFSLLSANEDEDYNYIFLNS